MFEGRVVGPAVLEWSPLASAGSKTRREKPIALRRSYAVEWHPFKEIGGIQFRYLLARINVEVSLNGSDALVVGEDYRRADELATFDQGDPFSVDQSVVERGLRGHAVTQNGLANFLASRGIKPLSPRTSEPQFDLAWRLDEQLYVADVKSVTAKNEDCQLRLGLGQLLHYSENLGRDEIIVPVLVPEREPSDDSWGRLCERLGVLLCWPEIFNTRLAEKLTSKSASVHRSR